MQTWFKNHWQLVFTTTVAVVLFFTGLYMGQAGVDDLMTENHDLRSSMQDLEARNAELLTEVEELNAEAAALRSTIDEIRKEILEFGQNPEATDTLLQKLIDILKR